MSYIQNLPESISELKRTARRHEDVSRWIGNNLEAFGITPPVSNADTKISLNYVLADVLQSEYWEAPKIDCEVRITVRYSQPAPIASDDILGVRNVKCSDITKSFDMEMKLAEWPFMTANLAMGFLTGVLFLANDQLGKISDILHKYIPLHFPGATLESLQALDHADLLPKQIAGAGYDAFLDLLYARRNKLPIIEMPDADLISTNN